MPTNIGTKDDDVIKGLKFKDLLFGKGGDDKLLGKDGNDVLNGGTGDDKLTGGAGKDTFVFGGKHSGNDVITDFNLNKDVIEIAKNMNGIKKPADVLKHATQDGHDVVIDLGHGSTLTLKDVKLSDLKKNPGDHFDIT